MSASPDIYERLASQVEYLRTETATLTSRVEEQERRLSDLEATQATKPQLDKCRQAIEATRAYLVIATESIAVVVRTIQGFGPDARTSALRSCQGKRRYATAEGAGTAAASRRKAGAREELRIYACGMCMGHHLTSVPLETFAERAAGGGR